MILYRPTLDCRPIVTHEVWSVGSDMSGPRQGMAPDALCAGAIVHLRTNTPHLQTSSKLVSVSSCLIVSRCTWNVHGME